MIQITVRVFNIFTALYKVCYSWYSMLSHFYFRNMPTNWESRSWKLQLKTQQMLSRLLWLWLLRLKTEWDRQQLQKPDHQCKSTVALRFSHKRVAVVNRNKLNGLDRISLTINKHEYIDKKHVPCALILAKTISRSWMQCCAIYWQTMSYTWSIARQGGSIFFTKLYAVSLYLYWWCFVVVISRRDNSNCIDS